MRALCSRWASSSMASSLGSRASLDVSLSSSSADSIIRSQPFLQQCSRLHGSSQCQHNPLADRSQSSSLVNFFGAGAWKAVEVAVGLNMAGWGVTLVLHTSWFNRSSWIRTKEITAISVSPDLNRCQESPPWVCLKPIKPLNSISLEVYDSDLHPCSISGSVEPKIVLQEGSRLMDLRLGGRRWRRRQKQLWELLGKVEVAEMATGQQEHGSDTR
ncbi:hypothetical protein BHE74_00033114 [Ensete ventricosum]|nr:hypothetical protein BHE74_00033114 [Ensete ventricosum]